MKSITIYGRYGRYPSGIKCFKRRLFIESINKENDQYIVGFSQHELNRFEEFIKRIREQGGVSTDPYYFKIEETGKWFESIIIEREENSLDVIFNIFKEDMMLYGNCLEL